MRLFVAVDVPEDVRDAIERRIVSALRPSLPSARWTRPEGRHLTLKFLGEVDDERVADVAQAVRRASSGRQPFEAALDRVGGFPNLRRPRVLWVGVGPGAAEMAALAGSVDTELGGLGFAPEGRPFEAHLTLARFRVPSPVGDLPEVDVPDAPFPVDEVVLFRSQLHPQGARYTALERIALG